MNVVDFLPASTWDICLLSSIVNTSAPSVKESTLYPSIIFVISLCLAPVSCLVCLPKRFIRYLAISYCILQSCEQIICFLIMFYEDCEHK